VKVDAEPGEVWPALRAFDLSSSPIVRLLFTLRGMRGAYTFAALERAGFRVLGEAPERSLALGVIARPWKLQGGVLAIDDASEWIAFDEPGYAKISWTFELARTPTGETEVSTETRVHCTDDASRKKFSRYWMLVGPFSSLIRNEMLRKLRRKTAA
jgi:hypothetical protein